MLFRSQVFDEAPGKLTPETPREAIPAWDSLNATEQKQEAKKPETSANPFVNASEKPATSANPLVSAVEKPTEFQEQIADKTPEEQKELMELRNQVSFSYISSSSVLWPAALRESWTAYLMPNGVPDKLNAPHSDGLTFAYVDGHAKYMNVKAFLALCPTSASYAVPACTFRTSAGSAAGFNVCSGSPSPTYVGSWPFWGLY